MMRRMHLSFDWKAMGIVAYVPFLTSGLVFIYCFLSKNALEQILPALEFGVPVFASWWSIFLFQDVLEEPGSETLFSYPVSRYRLGLLRVGVFFVFYLFLIALVLLLIQTWSPRGFFVSEFVLLSAESLFIAGLGYLSMVLTRDSGWSLTIILVYVSTQVLTKGVLIRFLNIFVFNDSILSLNRVIGPAVYAVTFAAILCVLGHMILQKTERFH